MIAGGYYIITACISYLFVMADDCDLKNELFECASIFSNNIKSNITLSSLGSNLLKVNSTPQQDSKNQILRRFKFTMWKGNDGTQFLNIPDLSTIGSQENSLFSVWISADNQNLETLMISVNGSNITSSGNSWNALDITRIPDLIDEIGVNVDIVSVAMKGVSSTSTIQYLITPTINRIHFPPGTLNENIVIIFTFNAVACAARYVGFGEEDVLEWNIEITSDVFAKRHKQQYVEFPSPDYIDFINLVYEFADYDRCHCKPIPNECLQKIKGMIEKSEITRSISNCDLEEIRGLVSINKIKRNMICCFERSEKYRFRICNTVERKFDKYLAFSVTSMETLFIFWSYPSVLKFSKLFTKCAFKCLDRFEGCSLAMLIISSINRACLGPRIIIKRILREFISDNIFLNLDYRIAGRIYGLSKTDLKNFMRYLSYYKRLRKIETDKIKEKTEDNIEAVIEEPKTRYPRKIMWIVIIILSLTVTGQTIYIISF